jgi:acyl dehydratase
MPRIRARTASFDSIAVGDELPILVKWETGETISRFAALLCPAAADVAATATGNPQQGQSQGGADASGSTLAAYVAELLEKGFPVSNIMARGSRLHLEVVRPVRAGDTLVLSGRVASKQGEKDQGLVECEISVENQDGETVALAQATVSM